jgi:hypothetical protein
MSQIARAIILRKQVLARGFRLEESSKSAGCVIALRQAVSARCSANEEELSEIMFQQNSVRRLIFTLPMLALLIVPVAAQKSSTETGKTPQTANAMVSPR